MRKVFDRWDEARPFFDPNGTAIPFQDATTALLQGRTGMMLIGTFFADAAPKDALDDIDFFRCPHRPLGAGAEEAPTDGYFASAKTKSPEGTKKLLAYLASPSSPSRSTSSSPARRTCPRHPDVDTAKFTPLVKKGIDLINNTKESPSSSTATRATRCRPPPTRL